MKFKFPFRMECKRKTEQKNASMDTYYTYIGLLMLFALSCLPARALVNAVFQLVNGKRI